MTRLRRVVESDTSGVVAIIVAIMSTMFLVLAAFAVDIGNAYANARQLSVSADAASLAAAAKVGEAFPYGQACTAATLSSIGAQGIAQAEADRINTDNARASNVGSVDSVTVACANGGNAIDVSMANSRGVPTSIAGIIGINQINPGSHATARYQRVPTASGLRPWSVCDSIVQQAQQHPDQTFASALDNELFGADGNSYDNCPGLSNGNWGSVDFDGGSNPAGDLADWTLNGYPDPVTIPNPNLPADPGVTNSSGVRAALASLVGKVVLFPSVLSLTGGGNNAKFNTVGIATVKICGVRYQGNTYNTGSDCWDSQLAANLHEPGKPDKLLSHIQFRWVNYATSSYPGGTSDACSLTDRRCVGSTILWQ